MMSIFAFPSGWPESKPEGLELPELVRLRDASRPARTLEPSSASCRARALTDAKLRNRRPRILRPSGCYTRWGQSHGGRLSGRCVTGVHLLLTGESYLICECCCRWRSTFPQVDWRSGSTFVMISPALAWVPTQVATARLERATLGLRVSCSIQLSYVAIR